jgi:hypothetical protein
MIQIDISLFANKLFNNFFYKLISRLFGVGSSFIVENTLICFKFDSRHKIQDKKIVIFI